MKYAFYIKQKDTFLNKESFQLILLDYNNTSIIYSDEKPRVEAIKGYRNETWQLKYSFLEKTKIERYIIYVPKGTIKNNYNLDAQ